jgi:hypothetical protein
MIKENAFQTPNFNSNLNNKSNPNNPQNQPKKLRFNAVKIKDSIKKRIVVCVKKVLEDGMELVLFALIK